MHNFKFSPAPLRRVERVQFGILSPEEIKQISVCRVELPVTLEGGRPKPDGLLDLRMGPVSREYKCQTCEMDECPGHFGHVELTKPVFHVGFMTMVTRILRSVCYFCSKLKCDKNDLAFKNAMRLPPEDRLAAVYQLSRDWKVCNEGDPQKSKMGKDASYVERPHGGCGAEQPSIKRTQLKLTAQFSAPVAGLEQKTDISPDIAYEILKNISDEDCIALGLDPQYARPDWMIITVLAVPPPQVRPTVMVGATGKGEDDLTYKLADIVKVNNQLKSQEENSAPAHIIKEFLDLLQFHVASYFNNEMPGQHQATQKSGRPLKTIYQRLKGKEGRVRGNLMGKRVDFSARSVITGDPLLSIEQVGVPSTMALKLTYPEIVTPFNLKEMQELVANGPHTLPGALFVIRENGERDDLRFVKERSDINLSFGDRVERHLKDGDYVIFNRQPSLHKMSMMGHRVKIMPYSTFRLNLSCTTPYNADFDGDEMNLHAPQNVETRAEISQIMLVPRQIVSPQSNRPVIGLVQDALLGASIFTTRDIFLEKDIVMNLMMWLPQFDGTLPTPAILKPKELWTGKQIFSMLLPDITLTSTSNSHSDEKKTTPFFSPTDTEVLIDRGTLISGILDSKTLGRSQGSVVHLVWNDFGPEAARDFLDQTQRIINNWMMTRGFTIGIGDTIADSETMVQINNTITAQKNEVNDFILRLHAGTIDIKPGLSLMESFEQVVNGALNKARDDAGKYAQRSLSRHNNIKVMVNGGSKGSHLNISQITACLGQQNVEGKRIPFGFNGRTLPHFFKNDQSPLSRGFVENSYLRGLIPQEFYFHAMGGREGVIDTAVKTSQSGYVQRRLVKAMEDVIVKYDGTVRNSNGEVIQFLYGEDGMDGVHMESQTLESYSLSDKEFDQKYQYNFSIPTLGLPPGTLQADLIEEVLVNHEAQDLLEEEYQLLTQDRATLRKEVFPKLDTNTWPLPVNIRRLIQYAQKAYRIGVNSVCDLRPDAIAKRVKSLVARLMVLPGDDPISVEARQNGSFLFSAHLRAVLASKRVITEWRLTAEAFEDIMGEIEKKFTRALVVPGESVGVIAAQSIGEPATQMTLNTFHQAGVSAKNVTLGFPRLKEIINVAQQIATPGMSVYLPPAVRTNLEAAKRALRQIEYSTFSKIVERTEIWYDPNPMTSVVLDDRAVVEEYFELSIEDEAVHQLSRYVLRLQLSSAAVTDRKLPMSWMAEQITKYFTNVQVIYSQDNAQKLVLRIRLRDPERTEEVKEGQDSEDMYTLQQVEQVLLHDLPLHGIPGVTKVFLADEFYTLVDQETGAVVKSRAKEWVLATEGSALRAVLSLPSSLVDTTRTITNDVLEVLDVLGIEAARESLLFELRNVMASSSYINYRHLAILADIMTYRGRLLAVTRHGINRRGTGPLMRCSFEETVDMLLDAAALAETDYLRGISENIILGNLAPFGTAAFELMLDAEMLADAIEIPTERFFPYAMGASSPDSPHYRYNPYQTPAHLSPGPGSPGTFGMSPSMSPAFSPAFSPMMSPGASPGYSPHGAPSPAYGASPLYGNSPASPGYSPTSPGYSPASPGYSPASPGYSPASPGYSPASPGYSPASPGYSPTSPKYSPSSPGYSPTSPRHSPTSPGYSPTSPRYSPSSPGYSPTSPRYSPTSPRYSPTSPQYSPSSPQYSPSSPQYSPSSPQYSPSSPQYSPSSPQYSPSSPQYSPSSPQYSPSSPQYSPSSPQYSPSSPQYSPSSPQYSPSSPQYSPSSPQYSPSSPQYSPSSPQYSPSSPQYSPSSPQYDRD